MGAFGVLLVGEVSSLTGDETCCAVSQVFYTQSLLCRSEDETPASTTLPIWLTSRACWAPDKAARLMVMHRNDNGMQLVITTYELGTRKSRDRVEILGKDPHVTTTTLQCFLTFPLGPFFFPLSAS